MNLSERTTISVSLVIAIIGGVFWLSFIAFATSSNTIEISDIKKQNIEDNSFKREVLDRLIRIEESLRKR